VIRFKPLVHIDEAIWRERLIAIVLRAPPTSARLTIVSAPAGFGKTTVLAQLARHHRENCVKVAWLNCDARDTHPEIFSENLLAALSDCELSTQPNAPVAHHVAGYVAIISEPLVIIIDDYEKASSVAVDEILEFIALFAPPDVSIVIGSRETPHIPLAQLQLAGRIRLIDAELLRFSYDETVSLLKDVLPFKVVEQIAIYADGWPFALQLARLRAASGSIHDWALDARAKIPRRQIFDYLAEEVFSTLSQSTITFLTDVAVLDIIDVLAANAIRLHDNSLAFIQALLALKPIVVVDEYTWSARLHPLLRDYLIHLMEIAEPGKLQKMHLRAAEHFASHHLVYKAVGHAVLARRFDIAARMIEDAGAVRLLVSEGELRVRLLLQQLPASTLHQRMRLRLLEIGQRVLEQNAGGISVELSRVEQLINESDDDPITRLDLELTRCVVLVNEAEHTLHFSPWAILNRLGELGRSRVVDDPLFLGLTLPVEIFFLHRYGPVDRCERRTKEIEDIYKLAMVVSSPWVWMYHARNALARGEIDKCEQVINESLKYDVNFIRYRQHSLGQLVAVLLGNIQFQRGNLDQAQAYFASVITSGPVTFLEVLIGGHVDLALCEFELGNAIRAIELLDAARHIAFEENLPHLNVIATATEIELVIKLNQPLRAIELASAIKLNEVWVSAQMPFALPWREVEAVGRALFFLQIQGEETLAALETANSLLSQSVQSGHRFSELAALAMRSHASSLFAGDDDSKLDLRRALQLARASGARQVFVSLGAGIMSDIRALGSSTTEPDCAWAAQVVLLWESSFRVRADAAKVFTPRELKVLSELAKSQTTKMIAKTLMLSPETVKYYLKTIFSKLVTSTREDAVAEARRRGIVP
jgi:ATP/maltotriose-dependent transcriptional regulator MalT